MPVINRNIQTTYSQPISLTQQLTHPPSLAFKKDIGYSDRIAAVLKQWRRESSHPACSSQIWKEYRNERRALFVLQRQLNTVCYHPKKGDPLKGITLFRSLLEHFEILNGITKKLRGQKQTEESIKCLQSLDENVKQLLWDVEDYASAVSKKVSKELRSLKFLYTQQPEKAIQQFAALSKHLSIMLEQIPQATKNTPRELFELKRSLSSAQQEIQMFALPSENSLEYGSEAWQTLVSERPALPPSWLKRTFSCLNPLRYLPEKWCPSVERITFFFLNGLLLSSDLLKTYKTIKDKTFTYPHNSQKSTTVKKSIGEEFAVDPIQATPISTNAQLMEPQLLDAAKKIIEIPLLRGLRTPEIQMRNTLSQVVEFSQTGINVVETGITVEYVATLQWYNTRLQVKYDPTTENFVVQGHYLDNQNTNWDHVAAHFQFLDLLGTHPLQEPIHSDGKGLKISWKIRDISHYQAVLQEFENMCRYAIEADGAKPSIFDLTEEHQRTVIHYVQSEIKLGSLTLPLMRMTSALVTNGIILDEALNFIFNQMETIELMDDEMFQAVLYLSHQLISINKFSHLVTKAAIFWMKSRHHEAKLESLNLFKSLVQNGDATDPAMNIVEQILEYADSDDDLIAAIEILEELVRKDPALPLARTALQQVLKSPATFVRKEALILLKELVARDQALDIAIPIVMEEMRNAKYLKQTIDPLIKIFSELFQRDLGLDTAFEVASKILTGEQKGVPLNNSHSLFMAIIGYLHTKTVQNTITDQDRNLTNRILELFNSLVDSSSKQAGVINHVFRRMISLKFNPEEVAVITKKFVDYWNGKDKSVHKQFSILLRQISLDYLR